MLRKFKVRLSICLKTGRHFDTLGIKRIQMYIHRAIEKLLKEALKQFPVCLITGPRQAGKSTLLQNCLKETSYVTLNDPIHRSMAHQDPALFLSSFPTPVIIDEIQYAPNLLSYIKMKVDGIDGRWDSTY